jgi:hypothetical protein
MKSKYEQWRGHKADFEVKYRFYKRMKVVEKILQDNIIEGTSCTLVIN